MTCLIFLQIVYGLLFCVLWGHSLDSSSGTTFWAHLESLRLLHSKHLSDRPADKGKNALAPLGNRRYPLWNNFHMTLASLGNLVRPRGVELFAVRGILELDCEILCWNCLLIERTYVLCLNRFIRYLWRSFRPNGHSHRDFSVILNSELQNF